MHRQRKTASDRKGNMREGDIIAMRSDTWLSRQIRKVESRADGGELALVSHVGLFITHDVVIEARARVVCTTFPDGFIGNEYIVLSPTNVTAVQRVAIAKASLLFSARGYGYLKILGQALDVLSGSRWFTSNIFTIDKFPICSYVVAEAYAAAGLDFGVPTKSTTPDDILDYAMRNPAKYENRMCSANLMKDIKAVYGC